MTDQLNKMHFCHDCPRYFETRQQLEKHARVRHDQSILSANLSSASDHSSQSEKENQIQIDPNRSASGTINESEGSINGQKRRVEHKVDDLGRESSLVAPREPIESSLIDRVRKYHLSHHVDRLRQDNLVKSAHVKHSAIIDNGTVQWQSRQQQRPEARRGILSFSDKSRPGHGGGGASKGNCLNKSRDYLLAGDSSDVIEKLNELRDMRECTNVEPETVAAACANGSPRLEASLDADISSTYQESQAQAAKLDRGVGRDGLKTSLPQPPPPPPPPSIMKNILYGHDNNLSIGPHCCRGIGASDGRAINTSSQPWCHRCHCAACNHEPGSESCLGSLREETPSSISKSNLSFLISARVSNQELGGRRLHGHLQATDGAMGDHDGGSCCAASDDESAVALSRGDCNKLDLVARGHGSVGGGGRSPPLSNQWSSSVHLKRSGGLLGTSARRQQQLQQQRRGCIVTGSHEDDGDSDARRARSPGHHGAVSCQRKSAPHTKMARRNGATSREHGNDDEVQGSGPLPCTSMNWRPYGASSHDSGPAEINSGPAGLALLLVDSEGGAGSLLPQPPCLSCIRSHTCAASGQLFKSLDPNTIPSKGRQGQFESLASAGCVGGDAAANAQSVEANNNDPGQSQRRQQHWPPSHQQQQHQLDMSDIDKGRHFDRPQTVGSAKSKELPKSIDFNSSHQLSCYCCLCYSPPPPPEPTTMATRPTLHSCDVESNTTQTRLRGAIDDLDGATGPTNGADGQRHWRYCCRCRCRHKQPLRLENITKSNHKLNSGHDSKLLQVNNISQHNDPSELFVVSTTSSPIWPQRSALSRSGPAPVGSTFGGLPTSIRACGRDHNYYYYHYHYYPGPSAAVSQIPNWRQSSQQVDHEAQFQHSERSCYGRYGLASGCSGAQHLLVSADGLAAAADELEDPGVRSGPTTKLANKHQASSSGRGLDEHASSWCMNKLDTQTSHPEVCAKLDDGSPSSMCCCRCGGTPFESHRDSSRQAKLLEQRPDRQEHHLASSRPSSPHQAMRSSGRGHGHGSNQRMAHNKSIARASAGGDTNNVAGKGASVEDKDVEERHHLVADGISRPTRSSANLAELVQLERLEQLEPVELSQRRAPARRQKSNHERRREDGGERAWCACRDQRTPGKEEVTFATGCRHECNQQQQLERSSSGSSNNNNKRAPAQGGQLGKGGGGGEGSSSGEPIESEDNDNLAGGSRSSGCDLSLAGSMSGAKSHVIVEDLQGVANSYCLGWAVGGCRCCLEESSSKNLVTSSSATKPVHNDDNSKDSLEFQRNNNNSQRTTSEFVVVKRLQCECCSGVREDINNILLVPSSSSETRLEGSDCHESATQRIGVIYCSGHVRGSSSLGPSEEGADRKTDEPLSATTTIKRKGSRSDDEAHNSSPEPSLAITRPMPSPPPQSQASSGLSDAVRPDPKHNDESRRRQVACPSFGETPAGTEATPLRAAPCLEAVPLGLENDPLISPLASQDHSNLDSLRDEVEGERRDPDQQRAHQQPQAPLNPPNGESSSLIDSGLISAHSSKGGGGSDELAANLNCVPANNEPVVDGGGLGCHSVATNSGQSSDGAGRASQSPAEGKYEDTSSFVMGPAQLELDGDTTELAERIGDGGQRREDMATDDVAASSQHDTELATEPPADAPDTQITCLAGQPQQQQQQQRPETSDRVALSLAQLSQSEKVAGSETSDLVKSDCELERIPIGVFVGGNPDSSSDKHEQALSRLVTQNDDHDDGKPNRRQGQDQQSPKPPSDSRPDQPMSEALAEPKESAQLTPPPPSGEIGHTNTTVTFDGLNDNQAKDQGHHPSGQCNDQQQQHDHRHANGLIGADEQRSLSSMMGQHDGAISCARAACEPATSTQSMNAPSAEALLGPFERAEPVVLAAGGEPGGLSGGHGISGGGSSSSDGSESSSASSLVIVEANFQSTKITNRQTSTERGPNGGLPDGDLALECGTLAKMPTTATSDPNTPTSMATELVEDGRRSNDDDDDGRQRRRLNQVVEPALSTLEPREEAASSATARPRIGHSTDVVDDDQVGGGGGDGDCGDGIGSCTAHRDVSGESGDKTPREKLLMSSIMIQSVDNDEMAKSEALLDTTTCSRDPVDKLSNGKGPSNDPAHISDDVNHGASCPSDEARLPTWLPLPSSPSSSTVSVSANLGAADEFGADKTARADHSGANFQSDGRRKLRSILRRTPRSQIDHEHGHDKSGRRSSEDNVTARASSLVGDTTDGDSSGPLAGAGGSQKREPPLVGWRRGTSIGGGGGGGASPSTRPLELHKLASQQDSARSSETSQASQVEESPRLLLASYQTEGNEKEPRSGGGQSRRNKQLAPLAGGPPAKDDLPPPDGEGSSSSTNPTTRRRSLVRFNDAIEIL